MLYSRVDASDKAENYEKLIFNLWCWQFSFNVTAIMRFMNYILFLIIVYQFG